VLRAGLSTGSTLSSRMPRSAIFWNQQSFVSREDGSWGLIWHDIGAAGVGIPKLLMFEFVGKSLVDVLQCSAVDPHWTHLGGTEIFGHWRVPE
jgi:hypothetical protein